MIEKFLHRCAGQVAYFEHRTRFPPLQPQGCSGGWKRVKRLSYKGHMMDALVPAGDEGRDKLR